MRRLMAVLCVAACCAAPGRAGELAVYSGGRVRAVVQELGEAFAKESGSGVACHAGGSGEMLEQCLKRRGDVYIAADLRHIRGLERRDLVAAKLPVAQHSLAILVAKGNPKRINSLADLARPDVRVYVEPPGGCQIRDAVERLLAKNRVRLPPPAVKQDKPPSLRSAPKLVRSGALDAAIVWDSTASRFTDTLDVVAIAPERNVAVNIVAIVLRSSPRKPLAERFAVFLRGERARRAWARAGFRTAASGASSRPAGKTGRRAPKQAAQRMIEASRGRLAPVYAPLAEQIVKDYHLARAEGVGIDVGSGPGTLIVELCKRTRMHWINADINPHFFAYFFRLADVHGVAGRVSAVLADAQNLPFRDDYADVIVSRGSYHFWGDRKKGFAEIYRVLKPGGVAYVGRGLSRDLPLETARRIRSGQGRRMKYDRKKKAAELREIMAALGIKTYRIEAPRAPGGADVNYGIWIELRKPAKAAK